MTELLLGASILVNVILGGIIALRAKGVEVTLKRDPDYITLDSDVEGLA